jgi:phage terminase large subunit GpA-like protein
MSARRAKAWHPVEPVLDVDQDLGMLAFEPGEPADPVELPAVNIDIDAAELFEWLAAVPCPERDWSPEMSSATAPDRSPPPLGSVVRILDALRPRPRLKVSEWADRFRQIPPGTSPEHGQWRTERTPYLQGVMDALVDPAIETVVVMVASQLGKSEAMLNILGYFVDQDPAPVLVVHPTVEAMAAFSKERIDPMFRATAALRGKLDSGLGERGNSRKTSNTIRVKHFPGGYLAMTGANAPAGLASRPIRVVLCDEVDRFPDSAGTEGDPVKLAIQRASNFHNRKIMLVSTPSIEGRLGHIQEWHERGDRRQFHVPCPHCGTFQVLRWEQVVYKNETGERDFAHVHYLCGVEDCKGRIEERHKQEMLAAGQWIAQVPGGASGNGKVVSFGDLSALYSPWVKWSTLAEEWCAAHDTRNSEWLRVFVNARLGQPFLEHEQAITDEALNRHRHRYGCEVPEGVALLTAGVDVQDDRLELEIVGWGAGRESWGIQYLTLMGDPGQPAVWQLLDAELTRTWQTEDGQRLGVACTCVDSGYHTAEVYAFCRPREPRNVWATKGGKDGPGAPAISRPTRNNRFNAALFVLGVHDLKSAVWSCLMLEHEGPGYMHFPVESERNYDAVYFKGLLSEKLVTFQRAGRVHREWRTANQHVRNEPWDCRVYATAALQIAVPDSKMLDEYAARIRAVGRGQASAASQPQHARRRGSRGVVL